MAKVDLEKLKELHSQGKSNREIARELSVHHNTIAYHLKQNNLECNTANQPIDMVSDTEARCKKCQDIKPLDEFQFGRKGQKYEYRFSFCNDCRKKQAYLNLNGDVDKFLSDRYNRLIARAKKNSIICSITKEEFISQYYSQNKMCFYTDSFMICEVGDGHHRNSLSIDKIIPELGYVNGNFVFCRNIINTCKSDLTLGEIANWMPKFWEKIKIHIEKGGATIVMSDDYAMYVLQGKLR